MLLKRYQQGFQLKKIFFLLFVCFLVTLWDSWSEANETKAYDKYYAQAMKLQKQKRYKEADKVFSIGISKYPRAVKLYYFRAKLRQHYMGNCRDAIQDYSIVIKLNPRYNPKAYWRRGAGLCEFGQYEQAIRDYTNCLRLIPNYDRVHFLRAKAYAKLGMIEKARNDLKATVKCDPKYTKAARDLWKKILEGRF
jgi:tetratricopeptide (TPR) repeat protein